MTNSLSFVHWNKSKDNEYFDQPTFKKIERTLQHKMSQNPEIEIDAGNKLN